MVFFLLFRGAKAPGGPRPSHYGGFMIKFRHITLGSAPLNEGSDRHRDLYMTTHNNPKRHTSMRPVGIRTRNTNKRAVADLRNAPCGHWDRESGGIQGEKHVCLGARPRKGDKCLTQWQMDLVVLCVLAWFSGIYNEFC